MAARGAQRGDQAGVAEGAEEALGGARSSAARPIAGSARTSPRTYAETHTTATATAQRAEKATISADSPHAEPQASSVSTVQLRYAAPKSCIPDKRCLDRADSRHTSCLLLGALDFALHLPCAWHREASP